MKKNVWDREYSTQFKEEMLFLKNNGIPYNWVSKDEETGIDTWKYKKTVQLFSALARFYETVYYK